MYTVEDAFHLYDGGWRSSDRDLMLKRWTLTDEEDIDGICKALANIEAGKRVLRYTVRHAGWIVYEGTSSKKAHEVYREARPYGSIFVEADTEDSETVSETTYREYPGEIDMNDMDIKDRNRDRNRDMNAQDMGVRE